VPPVSASTICITPEQREFFRLRRPDQGCATRYHVQPVGEWRSIDEIRSLPINDKGSSWRRCRVNVKPGRLTYARHLDQRPAVAVDISKERSATSSRLAVP
jgi:hypothetical protein